MSETISGKLEDAADLHDQSAEAADGLTVRAHAIAEKLGEVVRELGGLVDDHGTIGGPAEEARVAARDAGGIARQTLGDGHSLTRSISAHVMNLETGAPLSVAARAAADLLSALTGIYGQVDKKSDTLVGAYRSVASFQREKAADIRSIRG